MRKFIKWDPAWGWNKSIYFLGSYSDADSFFMDNSALYKLGSEEPVSLFHGGRLCAGSFTDDLYFGSISHDLDRKAKIIDQEIFCADKQWQIHDRMRLSNFLQHDHELFGVKRFNGKNIYAFRDPAILPNGNIAVSTGGHRWGALGNICEVKYNAQSGYKFQLERESILDDSMLIFTEIERATFWEDWMFFSVNGGTLSNKGAAELCHVAKRYGSIYKYHSTVEGSNNCYGFDINKEGNACYWLRGDFKIVVPSENNLVYGSGRWHLHQFDNSH